MRCHLTHLFEVPSLSPTDAAAPGSVIALAVPTLITRFPGHQIFLESLVGSSSVISWARSLRPLAATRPSFTMPSLILVVATPGAFLFGDSSLGARAD